MDIYYSSISIMKGRLLYGCVSDSAILSRLHKKYARQIAAIASVPESGRPDSFCLP
jgi:hypothetical protein